MIYRQIIVIFSIQRIVILIGRKRDDQAGLFEEFEKLNSKRYKLLKENKEQSLTIYNLNLEIEKLNKTIQEKDENKDIKSSYYKDKANKLYRGLKRYKKKHLYYTKNHSSFLVDRSGLLPKML